MDLSNLAREVRKDTLEMIGRLGVGHVGGCMSVIEALTVLYFDIMNIRPQEPRWEDRDRFIMSKGHAGPALYAVLSRRGYFEREMLFTLNQLDTNLPSHCDRLKTPGVDMTAGSLGQGLSAAVGMAIALKIKNNRAGVYCIIGDGESQEGQIWEAAMLAGHRKQDNLIVLLDYNKLQIDGPTDDINTLEPVVDRWSAFGWHVTQVNGHDIGQIKSALAAARETKGKPKMIILHTIKGYGAYFAQGQAASHNMPVTEEQWKKALEILS